MKSVVDWVEHLKSDGHSVSLLLVRGYFLLTLLAFLLLLPFRNSDMVDLIDHLLFSVSIVSTTGLTPSSLTEAYTYGGQVLTLLFIQVGGIGYMALISLLFIKQFRSLPKLTLRLFKLEFNLPKRYPLRRFILGLIVFTVLIETVGAFLLYPGFSASGSTKPIFDSIFHSISAFCTAGFSLYGDSISSFTHIPRVTWVIIALSLLGSFGFIVLIDFWTLIRYREKTSLTSRLILWTTMLLWIGGGLFIFLADPNLSSAGTQGMQQALFQSMAAHTTVGFNNMPIGDLSSAALLSLIMLMVVGASPAGTGGGVKTTSASSLLAVLWAVLHKRNRVTIFRKELVSSNINLAISSLLFYLLVFLAGTWILLVLEDGTLGFSAYLFECASALSTVGLSTGITGDISDPGKILICLLMFVGRLGVITLGFALIKESPFLGYKPETEDVAI